MSEKFDIPIAKPLEDQDDLLQGRDAHLMAGKEHLASYMADQIYTHAVTHEFKILLFCVSPKKRAIETAELVRENLKEKHHH